MNTRYRKGAATRLVLSVTVAFLGAACGLREDSAGPARAAAEGPQVTTAPAATPDQAALPAETGADPGAAAAVAAPSVAGSASPLGPAAPGAAKPGRSAAASGGQNPSATPAAGSGAATPAPARGTAPAAGSTGSGEPAVGASPAPDPGAPLPGSVRVPGPDSQGVTADKIRVGVIAPISGAAGFLGENEVDAVRAFLESTNAKGGVKGKRYQMLVVDSQFEPSVEATATKRLVEQDKVLALISVLGDSQAPYVTSKGIPNIPFGIVPPAYSSKYPTTYPVGINTVGSVVSMAYQLTQVMKLPIKSTAILYDTQNLPVGPWVKYMAKAWEKWGVQVKSTDRFNLSDADCTQLVLKMQDLKIDYWQVAQSLGWPICQQAMSRQNYNPPHGRGGPYTADEHFVGQAGLASDGVYAINTGVQIEKNKGEPYPWSPSGKAPDVDNFVAAMRRFSPSSSDMGSLENIWTQQFWVAAKLLDDAVRHQSDAITWKGLNQWLQSQRNWESGLVGPISVAPNCKTGPKVWIFQWKSDGKKLVQSDWRPYGGRIDVPDDALNFVAPGAGNCLVTAVADAEL